LRGLWLSAFEWYIWNTGGMKTGFPGSYTFNRFKIPVGLAKIFQQYAPYVDPVTGSTYRWAFPSLSVTYNAGYASVDSNSPVVSLFTYNSNLNSPLLRYLIHPQAVIGSGNITDLSSNGTTSWAPFVSNPQSFLNVWLEAPNASILAAAQQLFPCNVQCADIPKFAPDGSAYCNVSNYTISSPVPIFRNDIAVICCINAGNTPPDRYKNQLYDAPWPVVRTLDPTTGNQAVPGSLCYLQTLIHTYAYLTSFATRFVVGACSDLLKTTRCFSDINEFSYRGYKVDIAVFCNKLCQLIQVSNWPQSAFNPNADLQNAMFTMLQTCWSSLYQRLLPLDAICCSGVPATNNFFYASTNMIDSCLLYPTMARIIGGIGPVRIKGKPYFPNLGGTLWNRPGATIGWTSAVSISGVWTVGSSSYGLGPRAAGTPILYLPTQATGTTALTRVDPVGVIYTAIMCLPQALFQDYYKPLYPSAYVSDRWSTVTNEDCGSLKSSCLIPVNNVAAPGTTAAWSNMVVTISGAEVVNNVAAEYCVNATDVVYGAIFSLAYYDSTFIATKPLIGTFNGLYTNPLAAVNTAIAASNGSEYTAFLAALTTNSYNVREGRKKGRKSGNGVDSQYRSNTVVMGKTISDAVPNLTQPGSGDRTTYTDSILELGKNAIEHGFRKGTQFLLNEFVSFGSQNEQGGPDFFNAIAPRYTSTPPVRMNTMSLNGPKSQLLALK